jgi:hypothetical protein
MPWELEIVTIDVSQGDSSLILAHDTGMGGLRRSMLIDAGYPGWAGVVNTVVRQRLNARGMPQLDHLLLTHWDDDHSGGVIALLQSDNLSALCDLIALAAANAIQAAIGRGRNAAQCLCAGAAAAAAAAKGGYDIPGNLRAVIAVTAGANAELLNPATPQNGATYGRQYAEAQVNVNARLLHSAQQTSAGAIGAATGAVAAAGGGVPAMAAAGRTTAFAALQAGVASAVDTQSFYRTLHMIDVGASGHPPVKYVPSLAGRIYWTNGNQTDVPGIARPRTILGQANLGIELLWNTGPNAMAAPNNAPASFLVAVDGYIWNANPPGACPIVTTEPENDLCIAQVVRFNNFFFYTGGDLPAVGEDLIGPAVMNNGFNNPQGGAAFAPATRIPAFKCGHHGSTGSTSPGFLAQINPATLFISCGWNGFGHGDEHPTQALINRLYAQGSITDFYLTNCKYATVGIPASNGHQQLNVLNNRSTVCGDNADNNLDPARRGRGNAHLVITEAQSTIGPGPNRIFFVVYWDDDQYRIGPAHPYVGAWNQPIPW